MIKKLIDFLYYSLEIFSNKISLFAKLFIKFHEPSIEKEIKMSGLLQSDRILHIGCGAIPYTSILISNKLGVKIVGIDRIQNVVNNAKDYIKRYNLSNLVKIEVGNGKTYNVSDFNVIIISYGIDNKNLVLKNTIENINEGSKIILRRSMTERSNYIDSIIKKFQINRLKVLLTQESILLIKK